jgi:hypothetical protein
MGCKVPFPVLFGGNRGDWRDDLAQQRSGSGNVVSVERRLQISIAVR